MTRTTTLLSALAIVTVVTVTARSQHSREINKSVTLKADGKVSIDTYKGSITVTGWDKPTVDIHAIIESDDQFEDKYSEESVKETEIIIEEKDNSVRIKTDYDKIRNHRRGFWSLFDDTESQPLVHYTISMPQTAKLQIKDYKSRTDLNQLHSDIELNTYKGDVEIKGLEGSLRLDTYKGQAKVAFAKLTQRSRFETYKGDIAISLPRTMGFDLDSDLGYRTDFHSDFDLKDQSSSRRHRDIENREPVNGGGPSLVLRSTKGTISLRQH